MNDTEQYRHECEIRDLCRKTEARGIGWLQSYVVKWKRWENIRVEFWAQWRAGNRGEPGDWRAERHASAQDGELAEHA